MKPIVIIVKNITSDITSDIASTVAEVEKIAADTLVLSSDISYADMLSSSIDFMADRANDVLLLSGVGFKADMYSELSDIFKITERHCAVTARGSDMGYQSVPITEHLSGLEYSIDRSRDCYFAIKDKLPRYYVIPYPSLKCTLIRGTLVRKLGFFDPLALNFEDALINWCLRVSQYGFSTIVSNRVFIENRKAVCYSDFSYQDNFPYVSKLIKDYTKYTMVPHDKFASVISPTFYEKPRVLLSVYQLNPVFNGTSEHAFSVISRLIENYSDKYEFHILITPENNQFFRVSERFDNVTDPDNIKGVYHIGMTFVQIYLTGHLLILNNHCLRIVPTALDLISYRCSQLATLTDVQIFKKSIEYADGIITISEFTKRDLEAVFFTDSRYNDVKIHSIPIALPDGIKSIKEDKTALPFEDYILIFGFTTKHKLLKEVYACLANINANFIIVGNPIKESAKNVFGYKSGSLSYEFINKLYMNCKCLLYPSVYEGYGLPVINALEFNRKVIVSRTEVNFELQKLFPQCANNFIFFDKFSELKALIEETDFSNPTKRIDMQYTYGDTVRRTEEVIANLLKTPINDERFKARHEVLSFTDYAGQIFYSLVKGFMRQKYPKTFRTLKGTRNFCYSIKELAVSVKRKIIK